MAFTGRGANEGYPETFFDLPVKKMRLGHHARKVFGTYCLKLAAFPAHK